MDFAPFDRRNYPVVGVTEGYGRWAATYEGTVLDRMDLRLLERLRTVPWEGPTADLACGTGRIGAWLAARGAGPIDGVDLTPEMTAKAEAKGAYRRIVLADLRATGLDADAYALVTQSLACEHLPDLAPLYAEAARLLRPGGRFVIAGYHPFFLLSGVPTHFREADGRDTTIASHVHLFADHARAASAAGLRLDELDENVIDEGWLAEKPQWAKYLGLPISFAMVWR